MENADAKFDLYFLAFDVPKSVSHGAARSDRQGKPLSPSCTPTAYFDVSDAT